jgi:hypothetical protein
MVFASSRMLSEQGELRKNCALASHFLLTFFSPASQKLRTASHPECFRDQPEQQKKHL